MNGASKNNHDLSAIGETARGKKTFRRKMLAWLFMIVSLGYLVYRLRDFGLEPEMLTSPQSLEFPWLLMTVLLIPANWLTEARKWMVVLRHTESSTVAKSLKAILAGAATAFVTPNRVGDIAGRMTFMQPHNRSKAPALAVVNSLTQNAAILIAGIPAAIFFFHQNVALLPENLQQTLNILTVMLILFVAVILMLPKITRIINSEKWQLWLSGISSYNRPELFMILFLSLLRFSISCIQLYAMLRFTGIVLSPAEALMCIPASYLFVTYTPSFSLSEGIVRSSWAVFFIGAYSASTPAIVLAGLGLWLLNVVIPVVVGNVMILMKFKDK